MTLLRATAVVMMVIAAGCSHDDLCSDADGITCLTVKLVGDVDEGKTLARVQVDTYYSANTSTTSHRELIGPREVVDGGLSLPVEFAVQFLSRYDMLTEYESSIVVTALDDGGLPIGIASTLFGAYSGAPALKPGDHGYVQLKLTPTLKDTKCFGQLPPKCGSTDCPLCPRGASCYSAYTCASGACDNYCQ